MGAMHANFGPGHVCELQIAWRGMLDLISSQILLTFRPLLGFCAHTEDPH